MERCRTCRRPVVWAITNNGKRSPLDEEPTPDGVVALLLAQAETTQISFAVVLSGQALARAKHEGVLLRTPHFATCPDRDQHRKPTVPAPTPRPAPA